jgi:DNA polymerase-3 subunit epsilon
LELKLTRPIVFLDLETTGINVSSDRIVELALLKVTPDGAEEWMTAKVNPEIPIPPKSTAIHGISDDDVKDSPVFRDIADDIVVFMEGADIAGYNAIKFDIPVLAEEFLRAGTDFDIRKRRYVDIQVIFHKKEQRTLSAAYTFYCRKELENAHSSEADTAATYEILKAQLDRYTDLENDIEKLARFSAYNNNVDFAGRIILDENDAEIFNFGKHKGKTVEKVFRDDPSYYSWMMSGDFSLDTKKVITELRARYQENKQENKQE